jgi:hypothetical protein
MRFIRISLLSENESPIVCQTIVRGVLSCGGLKFFQEFYKWRKTCEVLLLVEEEHKRSVHIKYRR